MKEIGVGEDLRLSVDEEKRKEKKRITNKLYCFTSCRE
jgi:hypothetical protein